MSRWTKLLAVSVTTVVLAAAGAAHAAQPMVSVPSTVDSSGALVVKGSAVTPLANVTVRFAHAQAAPIDMVTQASAEGRFTVSFQPPLVGGYRVTVFDSAGHEIARGGFVRQQ